MEVKPGQAELTAGEFEADSCPNSDVRQTHRSKRRSIASAGTRARRRLPCAERRRHLGQADALEGCSRGTRFAKIVQQRDSFSRVTLRTFWNVASERARAQPLSNLSYRLLMHVQQHFAVIFHSGFRAGHAVCASCRNGSAAMGLQVCPKEFWERFLDRLRTVASQLRAGFFRAVAISCATHSSRRPSAAAKSCYQLRAGFLRTVAAR